MTACNLNEPVEYLAGDRFKEAIIAGFITTDSSELQFDELGKGEAGSN